MVLGGPRHARRGRPRRGVRLAGQGVARRRQGAAPGLGERRRRGVGRARPPGGGGVRAAGGGTAATAACCWCRAALAYGADTKKMMVRCEDGMTGMWQCHE